MPNSNLNVIAMPLHTFYIPLQVIALTEKFQSPREEELAHSSVIIVWSGTGVLKINNIEHDIARGNVFFLDNMSTTSISPDSKLKGMLLQYHGLSTQDVPIQQPFLANHSFTNCPDRILTLSAQLVDLWTDFQINNPFQHQQLFMTVMSELHNEINTRQSNPTHWLDQTLSYIDNHYNEEITREYIARLAGISPEHFSRTFRKTTGRTFNSYITLLRIRSAQQQLLTKTTNLNSLAQNVGYKEGTYLSRKFKQLVGVSPTIYQRKTKRVVSMTFNHTASLWTLGVVPELGRYSSWLQHVKNVSPEQELHPYNTTDSLIYNEIAAAQPDVIFNYNSQEENRSLISLAPVIELPFMTMDWREQFRIIANVVDKRGQAEEWLAHYAGKIDVVNSHLDHHIGTRGTAIVWEVGSGIAYCFSSSYGRGCHILYDDLGFQLPELLIEKGILQLGYIEVTMEEMVNYPADHIFIACLPSEPAEITRVNHMFQSDDWLSLEAVSSNQVYLLNQPDLFYGCDPLSSQIQLQELARVLTS